MLIMDIKLVTCTISLAPRKSISECIFTNIIIMQYTTSILYANGKVTARALCSRLGLFSKENCTHPTNLQMYNVGRRRCRKDFVHFVNQERLVLSFLTPEVTQTFMLKISKQLCNLL